MCNTYHFKAVQLLLNLLGQHWSQAIASRDFTSSIVLLASPSLVEGNPRAECSITLEVLRSSRSTLGVLPKSQGGDEIILVADRNLAGASVALCFVIRCAGGTRVRRIGKRGNRCVVGDGSLRGTR